MNSKKIDPDLVFVLMAVKPDMDYVFEAIRELGELFCLDVQRIIDIPGDYKITDTILDFIENASISNCRFNL